MMRGVLLGLLVVTLAPLAAGDSVRCVAGECVHTFSSSSGATDCSTSPSTQMREVLVLTDLGGSAFVATACGHDERFQPATRYQFAEAGASVFGADVLVFWGSTGGACSTAVVTPAGTRAAGCPAGLPPMIGPALP